MGVSQALVSSSCSIATGPPFSLFCSFLFCHIFGFPFYSFFRRREGFSIIHLFGYLLFLFFIAMMDLLRISFISIGGVSETLYWWSWFSSIITLLSSLLSFIGSYAPVWASTDNEDCDIPGSISFCTVMIIDMVILSKLYRQFMKSRLGSVPSFQLSPRYKTKGIQSRRQGKFWNEESVA